RAHLARPLRYLLSTNLRGDVPPVQADARPALGRGLDQDSPSAGNGERQPAQLCLVVPGAPRLACCEGDASIERPRIHEQIAEPPLGTALHPTAVLALLGFHAERTEQPDDLGDAVRLLHAQLADVAEDAGALCARRKGTGNRDLVDAARCQLAPDARPAKLRE